jgi:predicted extracellular nuclease
MKAVAAAVLAAAAAIDAVAAVTIAEINGNTFLSPLQGQNVSAVEGLVTAVGKNGVWLRSTSPDDDDSTSEGLYVYGSRTPGLVKVGDIITVDGRVVEYRASEDNLYLTELSSPANVVVKSSGNEVVPLVVGVDTPAPPTTQFSALDDDDIFGVPNAQSRVSEADLELDPASYGLDFWESLSGELVTIKDAYLISRPNQYGDVWIRGDWPVTGLNSHGGLTMLEGDANPETILIGSPVDGSKNPDDTKMGDFLGDITGVVYYDFGFYRILPLTAVVAVESADTEFPAVAFQSNGTCRTLTVANYNARNLEPQSASLPSVAAQIVDKMRTPDLVFLQEIQDGSGEADDGVTSGNATLAALADAIEAASGVVYDYAEVVPDNNVDGGAPGGNIRQAYLYRPDVLELYNPNQGGAADANEVLDGPELKFNPGRIEPESDAWVASRKPLVAAWKPIHSNGKPFFTVNNHFTSKGGSSTLHGDLRTPRNEGIDQRIKQAQIAGVCSHPCSSSMVYFANMYSSLIVFYR